MDGSDTEVKQNRSDRTALAYDRLRALIVMGQLAPGSRIIESEIAKRLGVSRTPVRSALQRLQQEGFIVPAGDGERSRSAVAPLTRDDARELFEVVGALEGLAAARTARLPQSERQVVLEKLEAANQALEDLHQEGSPGRGGYYDLDRAFHQVYVDAGAGGRVSSLHESIKPQAERYIRLYVSVLTGEVQTSVSEHRKIIEAIRRGASDPAREAVFENWRNAALRLNRVIDSMGERGSW